MYAQVVATGGSEGAAQGASTLSKAGVDFSINGFKEIAAATKAAGGVEGELAKFERAGPNPDMPRPIEVHISSNSSAFSGKSRLAVVVRQVDRSIPKTLNGKIATHQNLSLAQGANEANCLCFILWRARVNNALASGCA